MDEPLSARVAALEATIAELCAARPADPANGEMLSIAALTTRLKGFDAVEHIQIELEVCVTVRVIATSLACPPGRGCPHAARFVPHDAVAVSLRILSDEQRTRARRAHRARNPFTRAAASAPGR